MNQTLKEMLGHHISIQKMFEFQVESWPAISMYVDVDLSTPLKTNMDTQNDGGSF